MEQEDFDAASRTDNELGDVAEVASERERARARRRRRTKAERDAGFAARFQHLADRVAAVQQEFEDTFSWEQRQLICAQA